MTDRERLLDELRPSDSSDSLPGLRASDADRERVVEVLRRAVSDGQLTIEELEGRIPLAYAARTGRELELLSADLSVEPLDDAAPAPTEVAGGGVRVRDGEGGTRRVVSIMGGHEKLGRWRLAAHCTVLNILGGSDIDLNDAELAGPLTELNMYSILGGGGIRVPHGLDVQVSNFALMGGNGVKLGDEVAPPGAPTIHIRLVSIMGGSEVARGRKPTREERRRERQLRKARRRDLGPRAAPDRHGLLGGASRRGSATHADVDSELKWRSRAAATAAPKPGSRAQVPQHRMREPRQPL